MLKRNRFLNLVLAVLVALFLQGCATTGPVTTAVKQKDIEKLKTLIKGGENVNERDVYGDTPLIYAASSGDVDIVRFLIESGAAVNEQKNDGSTALMVAARAGNESVVTDLLKSGANVNLRVKAGGTGAGALTMAAFNYNRKIMSMLIDAGADVNQNDEYGRTALWFAAAKGDLQMVKTLVGLGADYNVKALGYSAADMAKHFDNREVLIFLLKKGAR